MIERFPRPESYAILPIFKQHPETTSGVIHVRELFNMRTSNSTGHGVLNFRVGDWVEVRSREEILATLDTNGCLKNLPFMPEMFAYCGRRFRVYKSAHKTCDTVTVSKGRKMTDAVHLERVRCNGQSHGGCEASCLIFWKTAWLRRLNHTNVDAKLHGMAAEENWKAGIGQCTEAEVLAATCKHVGSDDEPAYICQATQVPWPNRASLLVGVQAICRGLHLGKCRIS